MGTERGEGAGSGGGHRIVVRLNAARCQYSLANHTEDERGGGRGAREGGTGSPCASHRQSPVCGGGRGVPVASREGGTESQRASTP